MKNYFLLSIFLLGIVMTSWSQINSGEVIYKVKEIEDVNESKKTSTPKNAVEKEAFQKVKEIYKQREQGLPFLEFELKFSSDQAIFQQTTTMDSDFGGSIEYAASYMGGRGVFYLNLTENILLRQNTFLQELFLIKSKIPEREWEIKNEFKTIAGYECQKAVTTIFLSEKNPKMKITAWFTKDLPFSFGPTEMTGLPGLILGLERNTHMYYAEQVNLSEKEITLNPPSKGKKLSEEEFDEYIEGFKKDPMKTTNN